MTKSGQKAQEIVKKGQNRSKILNYNEHHQFRAVSRLIYCKKGQCMENGREGLRRGHANLGRGVAVHLSWWNDESHVCAVDFTVRYGFESAHLARGTWYGKFRHCSAGTWRGNLEDERGAGATEAAAYVKTYGCKGNQVDR